MNIFKKIYCRGYQGVFRMMMPMLPYREPKMLKTNKGLVKLLIGKSITNVMIVTDSGITKIGLINPLVDILTEASIRVTIFDTVVSNPTSQNVEDCLKIYQFNHCQAIIAFGGGSPIDCAKAVGARVANPKKSLRKMKGLLRVSHKLPLLIAIPTTAGTGSEATLTAVITDSETRQKYTINDFDLIPQYALLDATLTLGLPKRITAITGMDALTHAVEAYLGQSTTKETRKYALEAIKLVFENIIDVYNDGSNLEARENMLKASYLAGLAFSKSYVGYIHAIAHSLGGKYDIPHGLANAVILPYVLRAYGKSIYKKLHKMGVYAGLFDESATLEEGAYKFIKIIENVNEALRIENKLTGIETIDIPMLAREAEKEANPLYPVPKLLTTKELEKIYYQIRK